MTTSSADKNEKPEDLLVPMAHQDGACVPNSEIPLNPEQLLNPNQPLNPDNPLSPRQIKLLVEQSRGASLAEFSSEELAPGVCLYSRGGWERVRAGRPVSVCIGAFDGVHVGHLTLLDACSTSAHAQGAAAVALTFDPDPSELVPTQHDSAMLLAPSARVRALLATAVDAVCVFHFDKTLMAQSYQDFIDKNLALLGPVCALHVGEGFSLGARGAGNVVALAAYGAPRGLKVFAHKLESRDGQAVSATRIRALVAQGNIREATRLLGRLPQVEGVVIRGRGEGASFGFPTANVAVDSSCALPAQGVYAALVRHGRNVWPAAVNVGQPPSFAQGSVQKFLEANLLGFSGSLYDERVQVFFVEFLRSSRRFDSLEELERVVLDNISWVQHTLGSASVEVAP